MSEKKKPSLQVLEQVLVVKLYRVYLPTKAISRFQRLKSPGAIRASADDSKGLAWQMTSIEMLLPYPGHLTFAQALGSACRDPATMLVYV